MYNTNIWSFTTRLFRTFLLSEIHCVSANLHELKARCPFTRLMSGSTVFDGFQLNVVSGCMAAAVAHCIVRRGYELYRAVGVLFPTRTEIFLSSPVSRPADITTTDIFFVITSVVILCE